MSIYFQMSFQRAGVVGIDETQKIIAVSNSKTFVTDFNTPELALMDIRGCRHSGFGRSGFGVRGLDVRGLDVRGSV